MFPLLGLRAQPALWEIIVVKKNASLFRVGVDYYPEHWPEGRWETDARLMCRAGLNVVRLAEFAWARMEPDEGRYDFDWLDRAIATLGRHGISVILGTPTASIPPWLARKYPDAVTAQKDGQKSNYGIRQNGCFSSGALRLLSERITRALAGHYAANPHVIGWQTDNEFAAPLCYCEYCRREFQDWLKARYGTIGELNRAWGTHFWNHIYGQWSEIPLTTKTDFDNPSLFLDFRRFGSWNAVRFQHDQVEILRQLCPGQFVTHNLMGLALGVNYFDLARDLDFVSWDCYPLGTAPDMNLNYNAALAADVMRGVRRRNFWIMELAAGTLGWGTMSRNLRPGELRKIALQQVAHGADGIIWFRWRTCTAGREQYWHGVLGHDGKPGRRYREVAKTAGELHGLWKELAGTTLRPKVAIIYDYDSAWAFEAQPAYKENTSYAAALSRYYRALCRAGANADVIPKSADFGGYKVIVAPHLYVLDDATAKRLADFVQGGGILLADVRTAVKDDTGLVPMRTLPGILAEPLGIEIPEYESVGVPYPLAGEGAFAGEHKALHFAEWIVPKKAETLLAYRTWFLEGYAAATRNRFGKGWGYYVGTIVDSEAFYDALVGEILSAAKIRPAAVPPEGVEATVREGKGRRLLFLVNHTEETKAVAAPTGKTELLSGRRTGESLSLPPYGVAIVRL